LYSLEGTLWPKGTLLCYNGYPFGVQIDSYYESTLDLVFTVFLLPVAMKQSGPAYPSLQMQLPSLEQCPFPLQTVALSQYATKSERNFNHEY